MPSARPGYPTLMFLQGANDAKELLGGVGKGIPFIRSGECRGSYPTRHPDQIAKSIANLLARIGNRRTFIQSSRSRAGYLTGQMEYERQHILDIREQNLELVFCIKH